MTHEDYMRKAIALALKVSAFPFGAVIVNRAKGRIVAEGNNLSALNPAFHGEMVAINNCAELRHPADWSGLDLYTTAEPCPMCQSAIIWAGIDCVYYGTSIPYLQDHNWRQINIRASAVLAQSTFSNSKIVGGILEAECNALFDKAPDSFYHN